MSTPELYRHTSRNNLGETQHYENEVQSWASMNDTPSQWLSTEAAAFPVSGSCPRGHLVPGCTTADSAQESWVLPYSASAKWVIGIGLQTSVPNYYLEWGISIDRHTLKDKESCRWKAVWEAGCACSAPAGQGGVSRALRSTLSEPVGVGCALGPVNDDTFRASHSQTSIK